MTIKEFADNLKKFDDFLIFCHNRPDGDTIGSALALKRSLEKLGKSADIVCPSPIPVKFGFLTGETKFLFPYEVSKKYSAHVSVDCSTEIMINEAYGVYSSAKETFNIDHHVSNTKYAKYNYVEGTSACCELIYKLIGELSVELDPYTAQCLLLGISTDTGNFMHANVTENTLFVASKLVSAGADIHDIAYKMFKSQPKERAQLYGKVTSRMKFFEDDRVALIYIFAKDLAECSATSDMTEGFIDFPLSVDGVEVAVSMLESKPNTFKISFRSKGRIDVNDIASDFGGGGHTLASGCMICGFYEDVKEKVLRAISLRL